MLHPYETKEPAMNSLRPTLLCLAVLAVLPDSAAAEAGKWNAAFRTRLETVDDDAFAHAADAATARLRLGWTQPLGAGFTLMAEGEAVRELSDDFNSGANGRTGFPLVQDAHATELNQAWLQWRGARIGATAGRQRIVLDNQRFVGNVGWRQNEQTFDALSLDGKPTDALTLRWHWLDRVHRVAGDDARDPLARERDLDAHLFNAAWTSGRHVLAGYAYLLEDQDLPGASTRTIGARWTGALGGDTRRWQWTLEAAQQADYADNPRGFSHGYFLAEPALVVAGLTWKAGWERLDGDGTHAFQTPLATLHAFNGWADKFVVTPPAGLDDRYVGVGGKAGRGDWAGKVDWALAWHDYDAAHGDAGYGKEWNASLGLALGRGWNVLAKLADYSSDGFARDTRKFWLQVEWTR